MNIGDWAKNSFNEYIKIVKIEIDNEKCFGYIYNTNTFGAAKLQEFNTNELQSVSISDVIEKVFDEILYLRGELKELRDTIDFIKMDS